MEHHALPRSTHYCYARQPGLGTTICPAAVHRPPRALTAVACRMLWRGHTADRIRARRHARPLLTRSAATAPLGITRFSVDTCRTLAGQTADQGLERWRSWRRLRRQMPG